MSSSLEPLVNSIISDISFYRSDYHDIFSTNSPQTFRYFLRLDLNTGTVDTLERAYHSNIQRLGNYHPETQKAVANMRIIALKDSLRDEFYYREFLILMDPETLDRKRIVLPE